MRVCSPSPLAALELLLTVDSNAYGIATFTSFEFNDNTSDSFRRSDKLSLKLYFESIVRGILFGEQIPIHRSAHVYTSNRAVLSGLHIVRWRREY